MRSNKRLFIVAPALAALLAVLTLGVVLAQTSVLGGKVVAGAKEGTYRARIMLSTNDYDPEHPPTKLVPPRYLSFKTSPLEYTITPGEHHITVEIETGGAH